jgi:hypothetical protein
MSSSLNINSRVSPIPPWLGRRIKPALLSGLKNYSKQKIQFCKICFFTLIFQSFVSLSVTDEKGLSQPACPRVWKKYEDGSE